MASKTFFSDLLTTQTHNIRRGALRFATQISPLLNLLYRPSFLYRFIINTVIFLISTERYDKLFIFFDKLLFLILNDIIAVACRVLMPYNSQVN